MDGEAATTDEGSRVASRTASGPFGDHEASDDVRVAGSRLEEDTEMEAAHSDRRRPEVWTNGGDVGTS